MEEQRVASDKKGAQDQAATIVFVDECGFSQTPYVPRTWSPRGLTPLLFHWFERKRLNTICAIECKPDGSEPDVLFYMQPQNIRSESIIDFLYALHQEIPGRIVLLWDGYSSHKSKIVKEHIASQSDWLTVRRFPAYAPELNPAEYMFSALKKKDTAGFCADHVAQISDRLEQAAERIGQNEQIMQGFLKASGLLDFRNVESLADTQRLAA